MIKDDDFYNCDQWCILCDWFDPITCACTKRFKKQLDISWQNVITIRKAKDVLKTDGCSCCSCSCTYGPLSCDCDDCNVKNATRTIVAFIEMLLGSGETEQ